MSTSSGQPRDPISSDAGVKAAPPGEHPVADARALFLRVRPTKKGALTRRWIWRAPNKERSRRTIGRYPVMGLAAARQKVVDFERAFVDGIDPGVRAKRRQQAALAARSLTLGQAIDGYLAGAARPFKNAKSDRIRERALRTHFASLHSRDVAAVAAADVAGILQALAPETAKKAHIALRQVFDFAITTLEAHGVPMINPADPRRLRTLGWSPKSRSESKPYPSVHWTLISEVVAELCRTADVDASCMLYIVTTAARSKTARLTKWANIDFKARTWTPPRADLKDGKHHKRPFVIPLSDAALDVLERARVRSSSRYVFANSAGGPISESALTCLTRKLRRRHDDWRDLDSGKLFTVHGFRASLKTWTREETLDRKIALHIPTRELAELVLGHQIGADVEGAYDRSDLLKARREIMDLWARHCLGARIIAYPIARA
jgi:hypothetical protein